MRESLLEQKRRLLALCLAGSCMLGLSGCYDRKIYTGANNGNIEYTGDDINGRISYYTVDRYMRIVTFSQDNATFRRLVVLNIDFHTYTFGKRTKEFKYYDVETGVLLLNYEEDLDKGEIEYKFGDKLTIVSEQDYLPFLLQEDKIEYDYDVNELISYYHDEVEPVLDSEELVLN